MEAFRNMYDQQGCQIAGYLHNRVARLRKPAIWQHCVHIWQPCWSYIFLNATIRFLILKNMGLAKKIMFLSQLEPKLHTAF